MARGCDLEALGVGWWVRVVSCPDFRSVFDRAQLLWQQGPIRAAQALGLSSLLQSALHTVSALAQESVVFQLGPADVIEPCHRP